MLGSHKTHDSLYCDSFFIVVVWKWTHNISEICLYTSKGWILWSVNCISRKFVFKKKKKKRVKTRHETKMTEVKHSGCTHNSVCCQKRKLVWSSFLPTSTCPCFLTLDAALKKFLQNLSVANSEREGTCWKTDQTARWADSSFRTSQHQEGQSWIN